MKRISKILALVFVITLVLCSCSKKPALTIGKGEIDKDVFSYFLDYVYVNNGKDKKLSEKQLKQKASELCAQYVKINTKFKDMKLTLPSNVKVLIAKEVNNNWEFFGKYYSSIGVSKTTLTKIFESNAYKDQLLLAIYDTKGTNPIDEDKIKSYFSDNYIFFKSINGYLKADAKTEQERQAVIDKFSTMAGSVSTENTIDLVNKGYLTEIGQSAVDYIDVSVMTKDDDSYPDNFFKTVHDMKANEVKSFVLNDYIFVVQKYDNYDETLKFYEKYKKHCLIDIVKSDFKNKINGWYKETKAYCSEKVQNKCYNQFIEVRNTK